MRPFRSSLLRLLALGWLALLAACDDLSKFQTSKDEIFRGTVVGTAPQDAGDGATTERFLLFGFSSDSRLDLRFDAAAAARGGEDVGRVDVYTCQDANVVNCPKKMRVPGLFVNAPLSSIPGLGQDVLSRYDFPGPRRLRNFILTAPLSGGGHVATMFVSLVESGSIEIRIVAPQAIADGGVGTESLFGFFRLERTKT